MQIVINISKGRYEDILSGKEFTLYQYDVREVLKNGTPLPKGHGRLIDADALEKLCCENEISNSSFDGKPIIEQGLCDNGYIIWKPLFNFAPTIIEADKGE